MRAIIRCRADGGVNTFEFHEIKCPECGARFHTVADHTFGLVGDMTTVACVRGHRWRA